MVAKYASVPILYLIFRVGENSFSNAELWLLFSVASLRKLDEQPEWLIGGTLRDYQLEGLNFLVNRCYLSHFTIADDYLLVGSV